MPEVNLHGDTMKKIEELRAFDGLEEMVLSCKDDLEDRFIVKGRRDEKSKIGEAVRANEMAFVNEEEDSLFAKPGPFNDAQEEALFASSRDILAEGGEDDLEKRRPFEIRHVYIDRHELSGIELLGKEPQERSLAQACGGGDKGERSFLGEVVKLGQGLGKSLVLEEMIEGRVL